MQFLINLAQSSISEAALTGNSFSDPPLKRPSSDSRSDGDDRLQGVHKKMSRADESEESHHDHPVFAAAIEAFRGRNVKVHSFDPEDGSLVVVYYSTREERQQQSFDDIWNELRAILRKAKVRGVRKFRLKVQDVEVALVRFSHGHPDASKVGDIARWYRASGFKCLSRRAISCGSSQNRSRATLMRGSPARNTPMRCSLSIRSWNDVPGNYIFAKLVNGSWSPVYIGESDSLKNRHTSHDKEACTKRNGATHIHAHSSSWQKRARLDEETDIRKNFPNAPCNLQ
ncbi:MAG: hypothetical protein ABI231_06680 [Candidatus Tumulicola sp.]